MRMAIIALDEGSMTAGTVCNIIEVTADTAFGITLPLEQLSWDCGQYPVAIGDRWEDGVWSRDGALLTPVPTDAQRIAQLETDANDRIEAEVELDYRLSMLELGLS